MPVTPPTSETAEPVTPTPPTNRFFEWMRALDLPRQPGWIGGVCSGIAARIGIDPLIVRGILVVVAVFGGPALLVYAAAWLLLPDAKNKIHLEEVFRGRFEAPVAAIGAIFLLSLLPVTQGFWSLGASYWGEPYWGSSVGRALWTMVILGLIVWFIVWVARRSQGTPTPTADPFTTAPFVASTTTTTAPGAPGPTSNTPEDVAAWRFEQAKVKAEHTAFRNQQAAEAQRIAREQSRAAAAIARADYAAKRARTKPNALFTLVVVGLAIMAGALAVLSLGGDSPRDVVVGLSAALGVLALGIIINGVRGKRSGGASPIALLVAIALIVASFVPAIPRFVAVGNIVEKPMTNELWTSPLIVGAGNARIDLTDVFDDVPVGDERYSIPEYTIVVGAGDVTLELPSEESSQVMIEVGDGSVVTPPGDHSANGVELNTSGTGWNGSSVFESYTVDVEPGTVDGVSSEGAERFLIVHILVGSGDVTVIRDDTTIVKEMN